MKIHTNLVFVTSPTCKDNHKRTINATSEQRNHPNPVGKNPPQKFIFQCKHTPRLKTYHTKLNRGQRVLRAGGWRGRKGAIIDSIINSCCRDHQTLGLMKSPVKFGDWKRKRRWKRRRLWDGKREIKVWRSFREVGWRV